MHMLHARVRQGALDSLRQHYDREVMPALAGVPGCVYAGLLTRSTDPLECLFLTLWVSREGAEAFPQSALFAALLEGNRPFLDESVEHHLVLSEEFVLKLVPKREEPRLERYAVEAAGDLTALGEGESSTLCVRLVPLNVQPGREEELRGLYRRIVIPALRQARGCRHVFLTAHSKRASEMVSVTIWDSEREAAAYELSGLFHWLRESLRHTLSGSSRLSMDVPSGGTSMMAASEDVEIRTYSVLVHRSFRGKAS